MTRFIAFLGGDSQVGCTMTVLSAAEILAGNRKKVLVVSASGKYGDDFFQNPEEKSVDDLKANLISGNLEAEEVRQALVRTNGYWILPGVRDPVSAQYYPENCWEPLRILEGTLDYVLLDAGNDVKLGCVISALSLAGDRYFVMTQQEKSIRRFGCTARKVLQPLGFGGRVILNKYQKTVSLPSAGEIGRLTGYACAGTIPYVDYGWQAEIEKKALLGNARYARAVRQLIGKIGQGEGRSSRRKEKGHWIGNLISRNT